MIQLSASWRDSSIGTLDAMRALKKARVGSCRVVPSYSLCKERPEQEPELEIGVVVTLFSSTKSDVLDSIWPELRSALGLTCIHVLELGGGFSGCVHEYSEASKCPHVKTACQDLI